jgi:cellulose synthase/poly-beta-1,6-N-acetylglucosamine synthase-like glycosyltransferase
MIVVAVLAFLAWAYLLVGRGSFWRVRLDAPPPLRTAPPVVAVVPARDEAEVVGETVRALLGQEYPGPFRVVLVDDGSGDGTAEVALTAARSAPERLEVVRAEPTPPGWAGKVWAMAEGCGTPRPRCQRRATCC